jgi:hypothetical protein
MIHALGDVAQYVGALAAVAFVVAYHLSARWWSSEEGRHLMSFTGVIGLILVWLSWRTFATDQRAPSAGVDIERAAIYCSVAVLLVWRFWMLGRKQIWASWRSKERA